MMVTIKKNFLILTTILFLFSGLKAWLVRGVIRDIGFRSVENVSIYIKETGKHTSSLKDGYFEIFVPEDLSLINLVFKSKYHYEKTIRLEQMDKLKPLTVILIQKEYLRNEILVTAFDTEEHSIKIPKAQNIISELEIKEKISESVVKTLADYTPGVHFIGSGGLMATPSIRGLARRRVLLLLDGVRITGDRRAGNSGSFLAPELIKQIEVVRSSSSVIYGSDAIGGVIQLITGNDFKKINTNRTFNISLNDVNSYVSTGFSLVKKSGKFMIYSGFQYSKAEDYKSPDRIIYNSGFTNLSGVFNLTYNDSKRSVSIRYIGGSGTNIGKPDRENNPDSYSTVKENSNHIFLLKYKQKELLKNSELKVDMFLNPTTYILQKGNILKNSVETSDTRVINSGLGIKLTKKVSENFSLTSGLDLYGRNNLDIINSKNSETTTPLENGKREDMGIFISGNIKKILGINLRGGIRYTFAESRAVSDNTLKSKKKNSPSLFFGIVKDFSKYVSFFFNTGTSFRNPSLTESYYTGITGRKYVVGNSNLAPEKSINLDTGIKIHKRNIFFGLYGFYNTIDDMIERYRSNDGIYTFNNIDSGKIVGVETEFQWFPSGNLELFGHFNYYKGKSLKTREPLNDIPSPKLFLGGKINAGKSWLEINYLYSFGKSDPGPSEIVNEKYNLISLKGGYYFSSRFFVYCKISNLLNEKFYPNPDPDIPENEKINFSVSLNYLF